MNIGIDMDGVLTDIQGYNRRHAPGFFKKKFNRDVADPNPYDIRDIFKCPEEEYKAYWQKHLLRYAIFEPARKGAKETVRKLKADGHSIYVISKRVFTCQDDFMGKLMRTIVRNWLWRNGIRNCDIVFCDNDIPDSKRTACIEKHIDVMVDDEAVNINAIAPIAKVICFDASYNRECAGENIVRARDWGDVENLIGVEKKMREINNKCNDKELEYLIMQRNLLCNSISEFIKTFHNTVIASIAGFAAIIAFVVRDGSQISPAVIFAMSQFFFLILFFVLGVLFTANNDRDYIRAIDSYVKYRYGINVLFYNGELSYKHINKFYTPFSFITTVAVLVVILGITGILIFGFDYVKELFTSYLVFGCIVSVEIIATIVVIMRNFIYKINGKSKFYNDCTTFLTQNDIK